MRSQVILWEEPTFDHERCLSVSCEPSGVEHLATQHALEALVVAILPGRSRVDLNGLDSNACEPVQQPRRRKLWTIVRADAGRLAALQH